MHHFFELMRRVQAGMYRRVGIGGGEKHDPSRIWRSKALGGAKLIEE